MRMDPMADMMVGTTRSRRQISTAPRVKHARTVIVVMVAFKWDLELCSREAKAVARGLFGYPLGAAMHSKRQIAYVVQIDLSAEQVISRLREQLAAGCIENAWAFTPGADVAGILPLDALSEKVAKAWREVRQFNKLFSREIKAALQQRVVPMANGRGETVTTILDDHPLRARRRAA
jgi:hypothetical protein